LPNRFALFKPEIKITKYLLIISPTNKKAMAETIKDLIGNTDAHKIISFYYAGVGKEPSMKSDKSIPRFSL